MINDAKFTLHPTLEQDTFFVTDLPLCRVLLMNNALFPWLIMVPRRADLKEITDLSLIDRHALMDEMSLVSDYIEDIFEPDKINIGALGNMVSQLHIHVIGRYKEDSAWPQPVWGKESHAYTDSIKDMMMQRLEGLSEKKSE